MNSRRHIRTMYKYTNCPCIKQFFKILKPSFVLMVNPRSSYSVQNIIQQLYFNNTGSISQRKQCVIEFRSRRNISNNLVALIRNSNIFYNDVENNTLLGDEILEGPEEYRGLIERHLRLPQMGHQVFVIQPFIKWGPAKKIITTPELQLEESVALVNTLPNWKVVDTKIISLDKFSYKLIFKKGNLEMLTQQIEQNELISAVFISMNILKAAQHQELENTFRVPVYDRYTIVMNIFREHAVTKEAKLQVAIAEIPYIWSRLRGIHDGSTDRLGSGTSSIGGSGEKFYEVRKQLLMNREKKLKDALMKIRGQRELLRSNRKRKDLPIIAVVGYTNAGKTSLIKALTGEKSLEPKDELFATLDVTLHAGFLPSNLKVLYVDTIGFISDIPTRLIEPFVVTLEDAMLADIILHVEDISHPDLIAQAHHVTETLKKLNLNENLLENIVTVGNKIDRLTSTISADGRILISATKAIGLNELKVALDKAVMQATGRIQIVIRVQTGSEEAAWLYKEATVTDVNADSKNNQYTMMNVIITEINLNKFKHLFIFNKVREKRPIC